MELQWYVGIDWGKRQHQICLLEREGECCAQYSIPHTGLGFVNLTTWLSERTGAAAPETIGVVLERLPDRPSNAVRPVATTRMPSIPNRPIGFAIDFHPRGRKMIDAMP